MNDDNDSTELSASKLGTLEYWEEAYEKEIENFNDHGEEGEIWFGLQSAKKVLNWIKSNKIDKDSAIVDIGCGNGYTCCLLAEAGYTNLHGIDYSEKAIELAKSIADSRELKIQYDVADVLNKEKYPNMKYDLAIDKGTYDAIALCPIDPKTKRYKYKEYVCNVLRDSNSIFIITSCNWTSKELIEFFTENQEFEFMEELNSQSNFSFGGATGSTTSTVLFRFLDKKAEA